MREKLLAKMKEKHGESKMTPEYKDAKKGMLEALIKHMSGMGGERLKRVSVMSDSDKGLEHGLVKAHDLLGQRGNPGTHDEFKETPESEADESDANQEAEDEAGTEMHDGKEMENIGMHHENMMSEGGMVGPGEEQTPEEIDMLIAQLMAKKNALMDGSSGN